MSQFEDLPFTDFTADPDAAANPLQRVAGLRSAAKQGRIGGRMRTPGKLAASMARLDPKRPDARLKDFSGGEE